MRKNRVILYYTFVNKGENMKILNNLLKIFGVVGLVFSGFMYFSMVVFIAKGIILHAYTAMFLMIISGFLSVMMLMNELGEEYD